MLLEIKLVNRPGIYNILISKTSFRFLFFVLIISGIFSILPANNIFLIP